MINIYVGNGLYAQVDEQDVLDVTMFSWSINSHGYVTAYASGGRVNRKQIALHKFIAERMGLVGEVDHEDRNKLNCQRSNLRESTHSQNKANGNQRSFKGVYHTPNGRWSSQIRVLGKKITLGTFDDPREAAKAYNAAALKHFGKFASLNDVEVDQQLPQRVD